MGNQTFVGEADIGDCLFLKFSATNSQFVGANLFGSKGADECLAMAFNHDRTSVFIGGSFSGKNISITDEFTVHNANGDGDAETFLVELAVADGAVKAMTTYPGGVGYNAITSIISLDSTTVYISGLYDATMTLASTTLLAYSAGKQDIFAAKITPGGNQTAEAAVGIGTPQSDFAPSLAITSWSGTKTPVIAFGVGPAGNWAILSGAFSADFGSTPVTGGAFMIILSPDLGNFFGHRLLGKGLPIAGDIYNSVGVDLSQGYIYVAGKLTTDYINTTCLANYTTSYSNGSDLLVVRYPANLVLEGVATTTRTTQTTTTRPTTTSLSLSTTESRSATTTATSSTIKSQTTNGLTTTKRTSTSTRTNNAPVTTLTNVPGGVTCAG